MQIGRTGRPLSTSRIESTPPSVLLIRVFMRIEAVMVIESRVEGWSEVLDVVDKGNIGGAVVSKLESLTVSSPESGARLQLPDLPIRSGDLSHELLRKSNSYGETVLPMVNTSDASSSNLCQDKEEGWEATADRDVPSEEILLSVHDGNREVRVDEAIAFRRRRGRGSFLYRKNELYCDQAEDAAVAPCNSLSEDVDAGFNFPGDESETARNPSYGTNHVLVLYDLPPTIQTTQLETLFNKFWEHEFAIRWVNDTVALAVFQSPSAANKAQCGIQFPFKVRCLEEKDVILSQISPKDLAPPAVRPKTSARTAHRLIAHAMGFEPSNRSGSDEFRKLEEARKNRIHERQNLKLDAWGSD